MFRQPIIRLLAVVIVALALAVTGATATAAPPKKSPHKVGATAAPPKKSPPKVGATAKPPKKSSPKVGAAAAAPGVDYSASMAPVLRDELTGDFLGRGYHQRMRAEGSSLNIYDPPAFGGELLRSTPMDLNAPPNRVSCQKSCDEVNVANMWSDWSNWSNDSSCRGCFQNIANYYHLGTVLLAQIDGFIYMTGTKGNSIDAEYYEETVYRNLIYKLPGDGSCASQWCALKSWDLPKLYRGYWSVGEEARNVGVTSLAAGKVGGNTYIAVGLSDYGVEIYDGDLNGKTSYGGMGIGDGSQTVPTALAFDPAGSGLLAVGVLNRSNVGYFVTVRSDGSIDPTDQRWQFSPGDNLKPSPLSAAIGKRDDGRLAVAFGMTDGTVALVDPTVTSPNALAKSSVPGANMAAVTVTAIPPVDGTSGGDDFAVAFQTGSFDPGAGWGAALRHDVGQGTLSYLPLTLGNPGTVLPSQDAFRSWFPGFKQGRLIIKNTSPEAVRVTLRKRPQAGYGCWYAPDWADAPAFPGDGVTVAPGASAGYYTIGAYTAGSQALCAAIDVTGAWRGYLVITPVARPDDTRLVQLRMNRDLTVSIDDQTGGSPTVSIAKTGQAGAIGAYQLTVGGPAAPTPTAAPSLTATKIAAAVRTKPSVYRVDVSKSSWTVPGAVAQPAQVQAVIPPLRVQGSVNGTDWTDLGSFLPIGTLNRSGSLVTVSGGTFYWENPAGAPAYTSLRVLAGSQASQPVSLAGLPNPPAPNPAIKSITVAATGADDKASAFPNGIDQAQLLVTMYSPDPVPSSSPAYQTVYYRDEDGNLVTNLYQGGDFGGFVGVQPTAGAYPNSGSGRGSTGPLYDYASLTSTNTRNLRANVGAAPAATPSSPVSVTGVDLDIEPDNAKAATGFHLGGCSDYSASDTCTLAPATAARPALYQAGDSTSGPALGVQLDIRARTAQTDLPMQWTTSIGERELASADLTITPTLATLADADDFLPNSNVDATLISHGQAVPVTVPVGGG